MMSDLPEDEKDVVLSAEIMDRAERKAMKEQLRKEEEDKKAKLSDAEIEAALENTQLAKAEIAKRKRYIKIGLSIVFIALMIWAYNYLFGRYSAKMTFGICRTYLELNVQFPQDLRLSTVEDFGSYVRIWYSQLDAFGEFRMEQIQCHFKNREGGGTIVEKILINRREVDPDKIKSFNKIIPVIIQSPVDLTMPYPLADSLEDLQIDTDSFRFQLNLRPK